MKHLSKTSGSTRLAALLAGAALFGLVSQNALAAGTLSGVTVSNLATLTYAVGAVTQPVIESSVAGNTTPGAGNGTATTFLVDNKVNLTVTESGATFTPVSPGATAQVTTFTVTNNGNTAQGYNLAGANAAGTPTVFSVADNINVTITGVFVDANANGTYESGTDTATAISTLAPDASVKVFVVATIPAAANGDQAVVTLTATTTTTATTTPVVETAGGDTAGVDIVFADAANALGDPLAANTARDAIGIAQDAYRVSSAIISVQKTASLLCDPFNGIGATRKNIPGAIVQYTVTISNGAGATASATLSTIADTLDIASSKVAFDPGLRAPANAATCIAGAGTSGIKIVSSVGARTLGGAAGVMTNAADGDGATFATPNVAIDFTTALPASGGTGHVAGELKPGESATITYNVIVTP